MSNKTLTLSIVIPVYNEQSYLKACLDSIAAQAVLPDEVIVVDNNSTDDTGRIAKSYSFVRLLQEPQQHQSYAQATGFNAATSDIIGRIDADSILPVNWVKNVKSYFAVHPEAVGISSGTQPYDMAVKGLSGRVFRFYLGIAGRLAGTTMLWGANCALRRSAWRRVSAKVLQRPDIWEDFDLSICVAACGQINFVDDLEVASSFRAVHQGLITQTRYQFRAIRTFYLRLSKLRTAALFCVWSTMFLIFALILLDRYVLAPIFAFLNSDQKRLATSAEVVPLESE
jgi:glycosyltransferase involved in cell wall biosynthesis